MDQKKTGGTTIEAF